MDGESTVGGGSLPGETLPTKLVALTPPHPNQLADALRLTDPPVIARIEEDRLVLPEQIPSLIERRTLICGEVSPELAGTLREHLGDMAVIAAPCVSLRRASCLAELALQRLEENSPDDIATLSPRYLQYPVKGN